MSESDVQQVPQASHRRDNADSLLAEPNKIRQPQYGPLYTSQVSYFALF